ncbi:MAG: TauD/TfdA family dioxygenase [Chloroflexota bacterium]
MEFRSFHEQMTHYFNRPHVGLPDSPFSGPAAWYGRDLAATPEQWCFHLSADDNAELWSAVEQTSDVAFEAINRQNFAVDGLRERFVAWHHQLAEGCGVVVLKGLALEGRTQAEIERLFWGFGHHLGLPGAQNPDQELLGHVKDYGENNPHVRLYRTASNIAYHCDAADSVGLLCMQPAIEGGRSKLVSSVTLFNELFQAHPELIARLFDPFRLDLRDKTKPDAESWFWVTPCACDGEQLRTFYHSDYFRSIERHEAFKLTDEEHAILDFYDNKALEEGVSLDMDLEKGDIQLISNHVTIHARTPYTDSPEAKRHLLRLWLSL